MTESGWGAGAARRIGRYELRGSLGRGAMGEVFSAWDPAASREVALKTRHGGSSERFVREAQLTASLDHPGIVRVLDAGVDPSGVAYYACERVPEARDLREAFRTLTLVERVELVRDAAAAVGYAHARGIVHRDLKPDNLLVDDRGRLRVADFGLAGSADLERLTRTGALLGTPTHLAPEQWRALQGERVPIDPRSDVWALGVVLYEALTGELPFEGASWMELSARILAAKPAAPRSLSPEVSPALERVCLRALALDPGGRPPQGEALAAELEAALAARGARRGLGGVLAALSALVLCGLGVWAASQVSVASSAPPTRSAARSPAPPPSSSPTPSAEAEPGPQSVETWLAEARRLGLAGQLDEAEAAVDAALALDPRRGEVHRLRVQVFLSKGQLEAALRHLDAALELAPEEVGLWSDRAELRRKFGQLEGAAQDIERALELEPNHGPTRLVQGSLLAERGEFEAALMVLDALVAAEPERGSVRCNRGALYLRMGRAAEALVDLDRALELDPALGQAYSLRAAIKINRGQLEQARADLDAGLELDPNNFELWTNLGIVRLRQKDPQAAIAALDRALELNPRSGAVRANRGYARQAAGQHEGAARDFEQALASLAPEDPQRILLVRELKALQRAVADPATPLEPEAALKEARRLREAGRSDQALALVERVLARAPERIDAIYLRGNCLMHLGRPREAMPALDQAVERDPSRREHWNDRALGRQALGDQAGAIRDFDHVVETWPEYAPGWNNRAICRRITGDAEGAVADCGEALARDPDYLNAYVNRANALLALRRYEEAEADCTRALAIQDLYAIRGLRGIVRQGRGNLEGARADLRSFLDQAPPTDGRRPDLEARLAQVEAALGR